ncbi:ZIP family metal transporter [bacterium]|nr:ZIP family metal transporter [bacterium]
MNNTFIYIFASVLLVSAVSFVGIFALSREERLLRKYIFVLVSIAIGAFLGDAFFHLLPESFEVLPSASVGALVISGMLVFFMLERALHWHHRHSPESEHEHEHLHPVGRLILVSDGVHNFLDGVIIAASFLAGPSVGIATTIAVIFHEIPQEIGDFGVLIHAGYAKRRALFLNFLSGLLAVLGALVAVLLGAIAESLVMWVVPFAAGAFIYVASSDLIPELHKEREYKNFPLEIAGILLGIFTMYLLLFFE